MSKKIFTLKIINKYKETPSAYIFTIQITDELKSRFQFIPGQFITVHLKDKNGVLHNRHYSICSSNNQQNISFCVKKVQNGIVSNLLHKEYNVGDILHLSRPSGNFILSDSILEDYKNLVFVTGGSGITPIKTMINHALVSKFDGNIFLVYANRDSRSIIFHQHLRDLQQNNCHFVFTIDEPTETWTGEVGQLSTAKIEEIFLKHNFPYKDTCFFTTGPPKIIENVRNHLNANKVKHTDIRFENFFIDLLSKDISTKIQQITIKFKRNIHSVTVRANQNILDATLKAGFSIDHQCKIGNCLSCEAKLKSGNVYSTTKRYDGSTKILTCNSYPLNDKVVVDFNKNILQSVFKRNNLIIIGLLSSFLLLKFLSNNSNELFLAKGYMNTGHENITCIECHTSAPGTLRQQLQNNTKAFLNLTDNEYVDFGKLEVGNNECLTCHTRPNDVHPTHRFMEPRFSTARKELHPENCISCHNEHNGKRITIEQVDFCQRCHQDIKVNNDPLDVSHEYLISMSQWSTCLQCHDFHGNHIAEAPKSISDTISLHSVEDYFKGGEDPYGDVKKYVADLILNNE